MLAAFYLIWGSSAQDKHNKYIPYALASIYAYKVKMEISVLVMLCCFAACVLLKSSLAAQRIRTHRGGKNLSLNVQRCRRLCMPPIESSLYKVSLYHVESSPIIEQVGILMLCHKCSTWQMYRLIAIRKTWRIGPLSCSTSAPEGVEALLCWHHRRTVTYVVLALKLGQSSLVP